ncbi:MAG: PaaI family thioesterase [Clostridiaceae bacterium]|jgi:uncharacterized protein (TIGR00369 family)|nr:PaaI family thioesterase [Clostridiaceae bacterium]
MKQLNPEHITSLLKMINSGPYFELLGMKVLELGVSYSKVEIDLQRKHVNPFGVIHGGVYSSIIDTAAYWSAYCELDENVGFTSIDLSVNNLSMIREGKIISEGKSIKIGRSICLAQASVKDMNGKLLAHGTSKLMILDGKQSIEHAIEAMGYRTLPPKFLD